MLDRTGSDETAPRQSRRHLHLATGPIVAALAGLMGASGVAVSAAGAHVGGGSMVSIAGEFLVLHAGAALAMMAYVRSSERASRMMTTAAAVLLAGTAVFSSDLVLAGLYGLHPLPIAAPFGGILMMAGWLGASLGALRHRRR